MGFKIHSVTSHFPKKTENINFLKFGDKKKIFNATGINKRFVSGPNEDVITLSIKSAKKIISKQIKKKIGFLLFVSQTSPYKFPSVSCILQEKLGLSKDIFATDINMGCSGYIHALKIANSLNKINNKEYGLIICSDTYTKYISTNNKSCKPIFSDASTSTLLKFTKREFLSAFSFGVNGKGYNSLILGNDDKEMFMDGSKIAIFSMNEIPIFIKNFVTNNKIKKVKYFLLHQASRYVCEKIRLKMGATKDKFLTNYHKFGNTVSSTIPLLLKEAISKKKIKRGDILIACGFGVGLSWSIVKIKW